MKMTNAIQTPFFSAGTDLPTPTRFEGFQSAQDESHTFSRFDIRDAEGRAPEILCRVMLGLCLAYTFIVCLIQLAAAS
jgi:hypothetical protein